MAFLITGYTPISETRQNTLKQDGSLDYVTINKVIRAQIEADSETDFPDLEYALPADNPDIRGSLIIGMTSIAHSIATNKIYELNSSGTWVEQDEAARMDVYTTSQVNQLLEDMADAQENVDLDQDAEINRNADLLADLIDNGAKNLIQMTHASGSITRYGVTCTWDSDAGTMTLSGGHLSTDNAAIFEFYTGNAVDQRYIPAGTYRISGCPTGGSTSTYRAALTSITGAVDTGSTATFTITEPIYAAYRILISGNCDFSTPVVFKPMVCLEEAYQISDKFVPYCPSLKDLYAMVQNYHP